MICKIFRTFSPHENALNRANYCLRLCECAWAIKLANGDTQELIEKAAYFERFYARNHNRFLNIAYGKKPFGG